MPGHGIAMLLGVGNLDTTGARETPFPVRVAALAMGVCIMPARVKTSKMERANG
jgi:hypothetical protein